MSEQSPPPEDELAGTEQPFIAHLIELRDRIVKALIAVAEHSPPSSVDTWLEKKYLNS